MKQQIEQLVQQAKETYVIFIANLSCCRYREMNNIIKNNRWNREVIVR